MMNRVGNIALAENLAQRVRVRVGLRVFGKSGADQGDAHDLAGTTWSIGLGIRFLGLGIPERGTGYQKQISQAFVAFARTGGSKPREDTKVAGI